MRAYTLHSTLVGRPATGKETFARRTHSCSLHARILSVLPATQLRKESIYDLPASSRISIVERTTGRRPAGLPLSPIAIAPGEILESQKLYSVFAMSKTTLQRDYTPSMTIHTHPVTLQYPKTCTAQKKSDIESPRKEGL